MNYMTKLNRNKRSQILDLVKIKMELLRLSLVAANPRDRIVKAALQLVYGGHPSAIANQQKAFMQEGTKPAHAKALEARVQELLSKAVQKVLIKNTSKGECFQMRRSSSPQRNTLVRNFNIY